MTTNPYESPSGQDEKPKPPLKRAKSKFSVKTQIAIAWSVALAVCIGGITIYQVIVPSRVPLGAAQLFVVLGLFVGVGGTAYALSTKRFSDETDDDVRSKNSAKG